MAVTLLHNSGVQLSLGELNKNINKVGKLLGKISMGQRIVSAADDSATFAISEKMRAQLRALTQDTQNIQNGSSMLNIAERGIDQIVQEIRSLKELAINAANDSNTDEDRATIQKEFAARKDTINDIAIGTQYNGKRLLDGTYARGKTTITFPDVDGETGEEIDKNNPPPLPDGYPFAQEVDEPDPSNTGKVNADNAQITSGGVYTIDPSFSGTITVDTTEPVKFVSSSLKNVSIETGGGANIWVENLTVHNSEDESVFKFTGGGNTLTVKGNNNFSAAGNSAVINVGDGLNVQGDGSLNITKPSGSRGAGIGSDAGENCSGDILISGVNLTANVYDGAAVGSGGNGGSIGNIIVENATLDLNGHYNANIGSGTNGATAGDIIVVHSNVVSQNYDTGIGSGFPNSSCGDIEVYNSEMNITNTFSACIGSGDTASCGDIYVSNSKISGKSSHGACIGTGQNNATSGDITVVNGSKISHVSPDGAAIGSGYTGKVTGKIFYSKSITVDASKCYVDEEDKAHPGIGRGRNGYAEIGDFEEIDDSPEYNPIIVHRGGNPLWIHHGTQSGQRINVYINSMQTSALRTDEALVEANRPVKASDTARYNALSHSPTKQREWIETLKAAQDKSLDDINVLTRENANVAIRVLDGALEYALDEATTVGAYLQRLEYTGTNITTMNENVQNAESTIRDADMAREMLEYTKYNLLSQSSQTMLAQANQNRAQVLNLLG